jgi:cytochrome c oxidase subunit 2
MAVQHADMVFPFNPCCLRRVRTLKNNHRSAHCAHRIAALAVAWCLLALAGAAQAKAPLNFLTGYGDRAEPVVALTWGVLLVSIAVTIAIAVLLAVGLWHRPGIKPSAPGAALEVQRTQGGLRWVWIGVAVSSLILLGSVAWTMQVLARVTSPATQPALTIEVTGRQWWWQIRYLSADPSRSFTTANEIHIPAGVPVLFRLVGGDVIHSFWVPALFGKTDVIPGQTNETWLQARAPGVYQGQCTEYCGLQHARMGFLLIADTPAAFQDWWAHQLQSPAQAMSPEVNVGRSSFNVHCGSCHAVRGTDAAGVLGPDLSHLMTHRTLAAGMLANDAANLTHWISDPQALKPGSMMPKPDITAAELAEIHSYVDTLN